MPMMTSQKYSYNNAINVQMTQARKLCKWFKCSMDKHSIQNIITLKVTIVEEPSDKYIQIRDSLGRKPPLKAFLNYYLHAFSNKTLV